MSKELINVNGVSRNYGSFTAVDRVSFSVRQGEIFGLLGGNGAGKTSLIKMICGLLAPSSGSIEVLGLDVASHTRRVRRHIGYMSQKFGLIHELTVQDNLRCYAGLYGVPLKKISPSVSEILSSLELTAQSRQRAGGLTIGDRQKLALAIALIHSPDLAILDEPTAGADALTRRRFWEIINEQAAVRGVTFLLSTHAMEEVAYCGRAAILREGKLKALGAPADFKRATSSATMEEAFFKILTTNYQV